MDENDKDSVVLIFLYKRTQTPYRQMTGGVRVAAKSLLCVSGDGLSFLTAVTLVPAQTDPPRSQPPEKPDQQPRPRSAVWLTSTTQARRNWFAARHRTPDDSKIIAPVRIGRRLISSHERSFRNRRTTRSKVKPSLITRSSSSGRV
jgi:hypothetical protein